jgi:hypothetical protein
MRGLSSSVLAAGSLIQEEFRNNLISVSVIMSLIQLIGKVLMGKPKALRRKKLFSNLI